MRLKENLKYYLNSKGITAAELSRQCSKSGLAVPKATISGWMAGGSVRKLDMLFAVSRILNISVDDLLFSDPAIQKKKTTSISPNTVTDLFLAEDLCVRGKFEILIRRIKD